MAANSPLLNLSLELRRQIYAYVLIGEHTVHIHPTAGIRKRVWLFAQCPDKSVTEQGTCHCDVYDPPAQADVALLSVCKSTQSEGLTVLFQQNCIRLDGHPATLRRFAQEFPSCHQIRSLSLLSHISDVTTRGVFVEWIRQFCKAASGVHEIQIHLFLSQDREHTNFWVDGVLNYFRPLSRLPLQSAKVIITACRSGFCDEPPLVWEPGTDIVVQSRATALLLRGSAVEEADQVPIPDHMIFSRFDRMPQDDPCCVHMALA